MQIREIPIGTKRQETTKPGTAQFPLAVYHSIMSHNVLGYIPLHWNEELQFCAVTHGRILFSVNEKKILLEAGDGLFINSGYLHMAHSVGDPDSSYICLDAGREIFAGWTGSVLEERYLMPALKNPALTYLELRRYHPWQKAVLEKIHSIYTLSEKKPYGYELEITAFLYQIFLSLLRHCPRKAISPSHPRNNLAVQHIITYLDQHYTEKIALADLAAFASYTRSECCRIFKRYTGESIFTYLNKLRLGKSLSLLSVTDKPIIDIAYDCGFHSVSYYIEQFRKQFGCTPLQYRKKGVRYAQHPYQQSVVDNQQPKETSTVGGRI